jgi:hypothetical protein
MQILNISLKFKAASPSLIGLLLFSLSNIAHAITPEQAFEQVKNQPCQNNLTTDQTLEQSIRSHSQRDIGWRTFQEEGYYDVERAILVNKGMELHYRWRVHLDGSIAAENERAAKLCSVG